MDEKTHGIHLKDDIYTAAIIPFWLKRKKGIKHINQRGMNDRYIEIDQKTSHKGRLMI